MLHLFHTRQVSDPSKSYIFFFFLLYIIATVLSHFADGFHSAQRDSTEGIYREIAFERGDHRTSTPTVKMQIKCKHLLGENPPTTTMCALPICMLDEKKKKLIRHFGFECKSSEMWMLINR